MGHVYLPPVLTRKSVGGVGAWGMRALCLCSNWPEYNPLCYGTAPCWRKLYFHLSHSRRWLTCRTLFSALVCPRHTFPLSCSCWSSLPFLHIVQRWSKWVHRGKTVYMLYRYSAHWPIQGNKLWYYSTLSTVDGFFACFEDVWPILYLKTDNGWLGFIYTCRTSPLALVLSYCHVIRMSYNTVQTTVIYNNTSLKQVHHVNANYLK